MPARRIEYERPTLYPAQKEAIFAPERYALIEASTKAGKSVGALVWITEQAMKGRRGQNFYWVAPVYPQAKIMYRRLKALLPRTLFASSDTELTITLANGAVIWFKGSDNPDTLYGEDVYAAVIDEASRVQEGAFHAVRSTLTATQGPVRIIGNVRGRRNWFWRFARQAEAGEPNTHYARITARDAVEAGVLPADEIEDAKRRLPEHVFRELYMAEASDDGSNPFGGTETINSCVGQLSPDPATTFGVDLAKSVDWTVVVGLDDDGWTSVLDRWQGPWEQTLPRISGHVGSKPALIDSTGVGDPIVERLQSLPGSRVEGFKFTSESKQRLIEGLTVAIQRGEVRYPPGVVVSELEAFEYTYTRTGVKFAAAEGMHDDAVCALALAVQRRTTALLVGRPRIRVMGSAPW